MLRQIAAWRAYERVPGASSFPASEAGLARHEGAPPQQIGDFIYITDDFEVKEGARLAADLYVGKPLGFGLQGGVFLLQDANGKVDATQVLKVVFKFGIGGLFGMTNLEREWRVGRHLALLAEPGRALPGFMRTGAAVVTDSGHFRAIILERVVGYDVSKPVSKATFCDVHYLQQMLHSVFTALHRAQRQLAFHHADLRLANIMEAVPSAYGDQTPDISMTPRTGTLQAAALFDSQHVSGVLQHIPSSLDTPIHSSSSSKQLTGSKSLAPIDNDQPQMSQNAFLLQSLRPKGDASLVSQSSAARFKMIDFGLADFRETYGAGYVTEKHDTLVHRQPHRQPSLQSLPVSDDKVSSSTVHSSDTACCSSDAAGAQQHNRQEPAGCSSSNARSRIEWISDDRPERRASRKFFPVPAALLPEMPLMERIYRYFWRRKGDVYALLWDMQRFIDGRVWPKKDELEVRLMLDLVRHVTGVHVRAWFAATDERNADGTLMLRDVRRLSGFGFFYRNGGWLHNLRILSLRTRSFLNPENAGITAAEALTSPFFTHDQIKFFSDASHV